MMPRFVLLAVALRGTCNDPVTFMAVLFLLVGVSVLACYFLPAAHRALIRWLHPSILQIWIVAVIQLTLGDPGHTAVVTPFWSYFRVGGDPTATPKPVSIWLHCWTSELAISRQATKEWI
jgi:hypothetical protein